MRTIAAVIVGYIVIFVFVMASFSIAWMVMGPEKAFHPGTTDVTVKWLAVTLPLSLIAAVFGGMTAAAISRGGAGVKALAGFVLVLGLVFAVMNLVVVRPAPPKPPAELATMEAANSARQPLWFDFTIPFVGAVGVMIGGTFVRSRR